VSIQTTDCERTYRYGSEDMNVLNYIRDLRDIFCYPHSNKLPLS